MSSARWPAALPAPILRDCGQKTEEAPRNVIRQVKTATVSADTDISGLRLPATVRASQRLELAFKAVAPFPTTPDKKYELKLKAYATRADAATLTGIYRDGIELIPIYARFPILERETVEDMADIPLIVFDSEKR